MTMKIPLAWLQVNREKNRLLIAMAGIAFADMLMFMQLGFRNALYDSNTQVHQNLRTDLVLVSPQARNLINMSSFPRRRLYQVMSFEGVESTDALYAEYSMNWKVPQTRRKSPILVLAFNPENQFLPCPKSSKPT
jgi:putative ABC transport system permease protein